jgi:hypothetical protein
MRDMLMKYNKPTMSALEESQMRAAVMELDRRAAENPLPTG